MRQDISTTFCTHKSYYVSAGSIYSMENEFGKLKGSLNDNCLQYFDAVGWATGRASGP